MLGVCSAVTFCEQGEVSIFVCKGCTCWVCVRRLLSVSRVRSLSLSVKAVVLGVCSAVTVGEQGEVSIFVCKGCSGRRMFGGYGR